MLTIECDFCGKTIPFLSGNPEDCSFIKRQKEITHKKKIVKILVHVVAPEKTHICPICAKEIVKTIIADM